MRKGAGFMMVAVITALMVALTSMGVAKINQASLGGLNSSRVMLQAQQFAEAEAAVVKATAYSDLTAHSKADIQNSNGYMREVILSSESDYANNVKQRIATVKIYKGNETLPRYSLQVLKTNAEEDSGGGVPVGTIIAWPSTTTPNEGGTWLLCNGGSFSSSTYPKLYSVLGSTTLPSLNGRFLEGTTGTNVRNTKEAGLPNITGFSGGAGGKGDNIGAYQSDGSTWAPSGAFYAGGTFRAGRKDGRNTSSVYMDASRSSAVYGKSSTVQPASYLVRYYIKAK